MQKCFIDMEKRFGKATIALLFLSVLILAIIVTPVVKADGPYIALDPSQGPAGQMVMAYIRGFPEPSVSITFDTTNVWTATTMGGIAHAIIFVPPVSPGTYTVTARGISGVATTTFIVTQGPSPTPAATSTGTPTALSPTHTPPVTVNTGFWSPLIIAITSVVIACAIFIPVVYVKRGKQKTSPYQETSHYEPRLSVPSKKPNVPSKINQPANNSQQPPFTKICRHCKRTVRDDLNICPYCSKRLR